MEKKYLVKNLFFIFACLSLGVFGCTRKQEDESSVFTVTKPWREKVDITLQYVAQVRAIQHIEVRSFEKGYLQEIFVDEGQQIKKGDKIFQIMPFLMNAEYKRAKAEYEISKIEYYNTEKLANQKVVSVNELALAKAKLDKFSAELSLAKTNLGMTTIKAPFNGVIDRFRVRMGSLIGEGDLLTTLSDISKLWVYFNLSESDYLTYTENKKEKSSVSTVRLLLANGKIYEHPGQIDTIEGDFDNETGNIPLRATFPNPDLLLRHGETGNILLTKTLDNALVIPQKATFEVVDKRFVYVVNEKGVVDAREIVVDKEISRLFVIKSGISEQDTILLEGLGKLSKGDVVRTKLLAQSEVSQGLKLNAE
jgi:membrane fusion protein (multidrug efflux system)